MQTDRLQEQLAKLHAELAEARRADPQQRALLVKVMEDIARLLERSAAPATTAASAPLLPDESVADRLEALAVQFEADHPALAASVRRFVDLLVTAGL
ncbi:MAG TPA: DUF4404 family protein [Steroidobacteraceae bacterium]|nr:DUF4404 family protein [Steroidobacteraceae bacterium]